MGSPHDYTGALDITPEQQAEVDAFVAGECEAFQNQLDIYIESVIADPSGSALGCCTDAAGPALDEFLGTAAPSAKDEASRRESDMKWLDEFIGRQEEAKGEMAASGISMVSLGKQEARDDSAVKKVQVFAVLSGCPLAKALTVPVDIPYHQFMARLEGKLNEPDLAVFYEDPTASGGRVELDDDDSLAAFLDACAAGRLQVKLTAVPREFLQSRAARALEPQRLRAASRAATSYCDSASAHGGFTTVSRTTRTARGHWQANLGGYELKSQHAASVRSAGTIACPTVP